MLVHHLYTLDKVVVSVVVSALASINKLSYVGPG